jgi:hypothetical protein
MKPTNDLWQEALRRVDKKAQCRLQAERGYSLKQCAWLTDIKLIGIHKGGWAFPNCDPATGNIVSIHYRTSQGKWLYDPLGYPVYPLVIRGKGEPTSCHDHESQWDAFAIIDRLQLYLRDDLIHIITRGCENGHLVAAVSLPPIPVYLWAQDDGMTEKFRHTPIEDRPSSRWITAVKTAHNGAPELKVIQPPIGYKDWNDYIRLDSSATLEAIQQRISDTQPETTEPEIEISEEDDDTPEPAVEPFPVDLLAPIQKEMVLRTAEAISVHPNLAAIAILGAVAAATGRGLYAKSGANQTIRGNLFLLGSAISGEGKSESFKLLIEPLIRVNLDRIRFPRGVSATLASFPQTVSGKRNGCHRIHALRPQQEKPFDQA